MVNRRLKDSFAVGRRAEKVRLQLGTPESIARKLKTLAEAINWLATVIPKSEHKMEKVQTAAHCVTRAAEHGGLPIRETFSGYVKKSVARSHLSSQKALAARRARFERACFTASLSTVRPPFLFAR
jgi:hypothetical protein